MTADGRLRLVGGAGFGSGLGRLNVTRPLVELVADEVGVSFGLRWHPLRRLARRFAGGMGRPWDPARPMWFAGWASLVGVVRSRRAVVLVRESGERVRFIGSRRDIDRLEALARDHGIDLRHVFTTTADPCRPERSYRRVFQDGQ
ncbi:MAG: hypothetical protein L6367_05475 [Cellulomonas sp.]|nr:hypothetical protein [Cellulomonas sp.]